MEHPCAICGQPVYDSGDGTWFSSKTDARMCFTCAESRIKVENPLVWDSEKGCWTESQEEKDG